MGKLIVSYVLSDGEELDRVNVDKNKNAAFIESLQPGKEMEIKGVNYKISKTSYSHDGKKLIIELGLPPPWMGLVGEIHKD